MDDSSTMSVAVELVPSVRHRLLEASRYVVGPLPRALPTLLTLSAREDVRSDTVLRVLEADSRLAPQVLRLAISPLYARGTVGSLPEALSRLGLRTLVDIAFEAAFADGLFEITEHASLARAVTRHCIVTAHLTRLLCRHARIDSDYAFLAGLCHDVGFLALTLASQDVTREHSISFEHLWPEIDALHAQVSTAVVEKWLLPSAIVDVVREHHCLPQVNTSRTSAAVVLADHLSAHFSANIPSYSLRGGRELPDAMTETNIEIAKRTLQVDEISLNRVILEAERLILHVPG